MKLLFDQNLSPKLVNRLADLFPGSGHVQSVGLVCLFLNRQRGYKIPSSAAFGQLGARYVAAIERWAKAEGMIYWHD